MALDVGILIAATPLAPALAASAERRGLALAVVAPRDASDPGVETDPDELDPWTVATWVAARTSTLAVAVPPVPGDAGRRGAPTRAVDATRAVPSVTRRAHDGLAALVGGGRVLEAGTEPGMGADPAQPGWHVAPTDADADAVAALAADGLPVVIPVHTEQEIERAAAVAAEWRSRGPYRVIRPASVRARRVPGIDYDGVPLSLADLDGSVEPGDRAHPSVSATYLRGGDPGLVLRPRSVAETVDAVAFARRHPDVPLGIRSGGHGISGRSTNRGGIVIDVGRLNRIEVLDRERRLVRIGPGATWKQVAAALHPYGWALGSGDYGGVGVGGLATAGGIGLLSRAHALTVDHLRAVELVLADGRVVRASADENAELYWGVRGAGANFGIATAFEFEVDEIGGVGWAKLTLVVPDLAAGLRHFGRLATAAPRDTTVFLVTGAPREGQGVLQLYALVDSDDPDEIIARLTPFVGLGALVQQEVSLLPYRDVLAEAADIGPAGHHGSGEPNSRSGFLRDLDDAAAADAAALLASGAVAFFQLRTMGGATADVPTEATAFPHRDVAFQVTAMGFDAASLEVQWQRLRRHLHGLYLSFETDRHPERLVDAFTETGLARLRQLKRRYDPTFVFRDNFPIDPDSDSDPDRRAA